MKTLITPSILSADLAHLQDEVATIEKYADWIQIDVMDGHFVPNLSFGAPVVAHLKTALPLDVHLMVENPEDRIEEFLELNVKNITFHAEAVEETDSRRALIKAIRDGNATAGIALNPATPVEIIDDVVEDVDLVLIMSVHPGFGGQAFIPSVLEKVRTLRERFPDLMIQIDGGINDETASLAREAGCNNLVAGSFVFGARDRAKAIRLLRGI
ncbi:MAG TPA: ribulose-phosphate 3-epimerase [Candidatus Peribacteraceae bacterium]|nr:ribulose-phosphate 3-epimerase [Candidatus Peribacteraceae bacterium]